MYDLISDTNARALMNLRTLLIQFYSETDVFRKIQLTMYKFFITTSQYLSWFIIKPIFSLLYKIDIKDGDKLKNLSGPLVIVSNHISIFDSFTFRLIPGFFCKILPYRFMAVKSFRVRKLNILTKLGIIPLIYKIFGVFIVRPGQGVEVGIKVAQDIILNKGVVVIFPEGRMTDGDMIYPFKWGAAALAITTDTPVLPISIKKVGKKFLINVGDPILLDIDLPLEDGTEIMRNKVIELFESRTN